MWFSCCSRLTGCWAETSGGMTSWKLLTKSALLSGWKLKILCSCCTQGSTFQRNSHIFTVFSENVIFILYSYIDLILVVQISDTFPLIPLSLILKDEVINFDIKIIILDSKDPKRHWFVPFGGLFDPLRAHIWPPWLCFSHHQWVDGKTQRCAAHSGRLHVVLRHYLQVRLRLPERRRLLVHGRCRLDHWTLLRLLWANGKCRYRGYCEFVL